MTETIGRFDLRKRLGGGGFGEVFLGEDPAIGRLVAIKVFRPKDENLIAFATSSNTEGLDILRERFLNEAKILAQLEHVVYVVNVLEYGELPDGAPYYVMPYLPHSLADELGKDVFDTVAVEELGIEQRPRALPLDRCLVISEQLLQGLAATHAEGLVHRDIKPANVMLTESGEVRLADFGIAKAPDGQHSTISHLGMGSRNYMAPEQRESAKHVDARADVYAVGRVMYRMLTGKLPVGRFADPNVAVPALGKSMNAVILAAMSEDRADRPKDASELLARFLQAKSDVGRLEAGEHSGTWAGEQGHSGLRDELKPLRARVSALLGDYGFVPAAQREALRAMAAVADLDEAGLAGLIAETAKSDPGLLAKQQLASLLRERRERAGKALKPPMLDDYSAAAEAVSWAGADLGRVLQAIEGDQRAVPAGPARSSPVQSTVTTSTQVKARPRWQLAIAAMVLLALAGWGVFAWRAGQIEDEERERKVGRISQVEQESMTACDELASSPEDPSRPEGVAGLELHLIDKATALRSCELAVRVSDSPRYAYQLGRALEANNRYPEAVEKYRLAAESQYPAAQASLGQMYDEGLGVENDPEQAFTWFLRAAEAGIPHMAAAVGVMYAMGRGTVQDGQQAERWLTKAAESGDVWGQFALGRLYDMGMGVPADFKLAEQWYRRAAENGSSDGLFGMGRLYALGRGLDQNDTQAAAWFQRAAERGHLSAQAVLASMFEDGRGVDQDHDLALRWLRRAAEAGHSGAQRELAVRYLDGNGVDEDPLEGLAWARKSAEQGDPDGQYLLGMLYSENDIVAQDASQALMWLEKAALQGHLDAQTSLAWVYVEGEGFPHDLDKAKHWYRKAAEQGSTEAVEALKELGR